MTASLNYKYNRINMRNYNKIMQFKNKKFSHQEAKASQCLLKKILIFQI